VWKKGYFSIVINRKEDEQQKTFKRKEASEKGKPRIGRKTIFRGLTGKLEKTKAINLLRRATALNLRQRTFQEEEGPSAKRAAHWGVVRGNSRRARRSTLERMEKKKKAIPPKRAGGGRGNGPRRNEQK